MLSVFVLEFGQAILGAIWLGMIIAFILFLYQYMHFYNEGVRNGKKEYEITYKQLDKSARKVVLGFIMFIVMSATLYYVETEPFVATVVKGAVVDMVLLPLLHWHYGNEDKFNFRHVGK